MSFSSFLKLFLPKDRIFYSLFEEVTGTLIEMGNVFMAAVKEEDHAKRLDLFRSLENLEHKNDEVTHRIFIELGRNFITPFDREDIHSLTSSLDDIADYIWGAAKRVLNYGIDDFDKITIAFADNIQKSIKELDTAVCEIRNMK